MYNWLKKGILIGGLVLSSFNLQSQTIESIINRIETNSQDTLKLTMDKAIQLSLENNIDIQQRKLILSKDSINYKIQVNDRTKPKIKGSINVGYNLKDGITDFKNTMAYPEASISFSVPILNPDNKYTLKIYLNNIKENEINLAYNITNTIRATSETYINILNLNNHLKTVNNEMKYIDSLLTYGDSSKVKLVKTDLLNLKQQTLKDYQKIEQLIESQKTILRKSFGTISPIELVFEDDLTIPNVNIFNDKEFDSTNIQEYEKHLAAYATIIRTQVERIKIENAILNYAKKKNVEFSISTNANFRNSVVPAPYFGAPFNVGLYFNILGNNYKLNKKLTEINIEMQELNIEKTILNIAPNVISTYENFLMYLKLASLENRNMYAQQLEETTALLFKKGELTNDEKNYLNKLPDIISKHYSAIREYYDNITIANKKEADLYSFVLYYENPDKKAKEIEKNQPPRNIEGKKFKNTKNYLLKDYHHQKQEFKTNSPINKPTTKSITRPINQTKMYHRKY